MLLSSWLGQCLQHWPAQSLKVISLFSLYTCSARSAQGLHGRSSLGGVVRRCKAVSAVAILKWLSGTCAESRTQFGLVKSPNSFMSAETCFAGEGSKDGYSGHAQVACESGALRALAQLGRGGRAAADTAIPGLHSTVLMPLLAGMVAAFGLTPNNVPVEDLGHILQLFSAIYEGTISRTSCSIQPLHPLSFLAVQLLFWQESLIQTTKDPNNVAWAASPHGASHPSVDKHSMLSRYLQASETCVWSFGTRQA